MQSGLNRSGHLVIAGDGPLLPQVEARCAQLTSVDFKGPQSRQDVEQLRRTTSVCVAPSLWFEANPLTILESFAFARPVIATRAGALARLVDDEVGWAVDSNPDSLARAMSESLDAVESQRRGRSARARFLERYRPEVVTQELLRIYEKVVVT